jgi:hypothetical protein
MGSVSSFVVFNHTFPPKHKTPERITANLRTWVSKDLEPGEIMRMPGCSGAKPKVGSRDCSRCFPEIPKAKRPEEKNR